MCVCNASHHFTTISCLKLSGPGITVKQQFAHLSDFCLAFYSIRLVRDVDFPHVFVNVVHEYLMRSFFRIHKSNDFVFLEHFHFYVSCLAT